MMLINSRTIDFLADFLVEVSAEYETEVFALTSMDIQIENQLFAKLIGNPGLIKPNEKEGILKTSIDRAESQFNKWNDRIRTAPQKYTSAQAMRMWLAYYWDGLYLPVYNAEMGITELDFDYYCKRIEDNYRTKLPVIFEKSETAIIAYTVDFLAQKEKIFEINAFEQAFTADWFKSEADTVIFNSYHENYIYNSEHFGRLNGNIYHFTDDLYSNCYVILKANNTNDIIIAIEAMDEFDFMVPDMYHLTKRENNNDDRE